MDEGYTEDVTEVSRAEDVRTQGKESENLVESCNVLAPQERVIPRERDLQRSSVQQFVDILGGKDTSSENVVEIPEDPCTSNLGTGDGRVHELTLGNYSTNHTVSEGELMDTSLLDDWQHRNQIGLESEAETTHKHITHREKCQKSLFWKESRPAYTLAGQGYSHNAIPSPGQSTYDESDAVLQHALTTGAMRMKVISKSSEYPGYFVKNTLKGKGILCRGPSSVGEFKGQNIVRTVSAPVAASSPPVKIGEKSVAASSPPVKIGEKSVAASSPTVKIGEKSVLPSECDNNAAASNKTLNVGMNLRELMRSRQLNKVDSMYIFKHALDLVYSLHLEGMVLMDLRPSCFRFLPSKTIEYFGRVCAQTEMPRSVMHKDAQKSLALKRPLEQRMPPHSNLGSKYQKSNNIANFSKLKSQCQWGHGPRPVINKVDASVAGPADSKTSTGLHIPPSAQQHAFSEDEKQEDKWYRSPEELSGRVCTSSSNIYSIGVLFFELLSSFDSVEMQATAMSDLRHRILSPNFLSESPKEAGFCLWLLHPEPSSRPTSREILQSEVMSEIQTFCGDEKSSSIQEDEVESELLLHFLLSVKEQKQKHAATLVEHLGCIESDIKELEKRHPLKNTMMGSCTGEEVKYAMQGDFLFHGNELSNPVTNGGDARFLKNAAQLESAYFSARSQIRCPADGSGDHVNRDILTFREDWHSDQNDEQEQKPLDDRGAFFDGLCKYARYNKLKVRGTIRNRDITNSTNVVCSLSFDRDEEYFAAAGVSKKIKIFDFQALYDNSVDIHYPVVEMANKSKLSCVCWNSYIRNYLTSTDYDGIVKLWDASTGQEISQHTEHEKRAWSVDFSTLDPVKLASGSDDCSVKLWRINERKCLDTIRNIANVCCVQFSPYSSHLLAFGSADYKIYCYDLRNANAPWCVLAGHEKAVSYVKFVDSGTLASASTDNTLKLWDLSRTSSVGLSNNACSLTLGGHKNEKNFVGLSVSEGYITCGSETNEVYTYYKSLPMPITSHKFGSIDPISGKETDNCNGQFVSSVCWKGKSKTVVAANSSGCIKVLEMV